MWISPAYAQAVGGGFDIVSLAPMVLILVVGLFIAIKSGERIRDILAATWDAAQFVFAAAFALAVFAVMALIVYAGVLLVFRHAYGIELPNPASWIPPIWRQRFGV